jgi:hypothetical protein
MIISQAAQALHIQVLYIGEAVGKTPGDVAIVASDYAWQAGEADTDGVYTGNVSFARIFVASDQVVLVPDGRDGEGQMHIVSKQGAADRRLPASTQLLYPGLRMKMADKGGLAGASMADLADIGTTSQGTTWPTAQVGRFKPGGVSPAA